LQGLFLHFADFFAELVHVNEQASCLIIQTGIKQILCGLFQLSVELGEFFFFFCHAYRVAQPRKNARDFFRLGESIFVDDFPNGRLNFYDKHFLRNLARFLPSIFCKCFIFNDLGRAAGRARASCW
jgi:hypothetical protein